MAPGSMVSHQKAVRLSMYLETSDRISGIGSGCPSPRKVISESAATTFATSSAAAVINEGITPGSTITQEKARLSYSRKLGGCKLRSRFNATRVARHGVGQGQKQRPHQEDGRYAIPMSDELTDLRAKILATLGLMAAAIWPSDILTQIPSGKDLDALMLKVQSNLSKDGLNSVGDEKARLLAKSAAVSVHQSWAKRRRDRESDNHRRKGPKHIDDADRPRYRLNCRSESETKGYEGDRGKPSIAYREKNSREEITPDRVRTTPMADGGSEKRFSSSHLWVKGLNLKAQQW